MLQRSPLLRRNRRDFLGANSLLRSCFRERGENIFEGSVSDWEAMKELILRGIFEGVQELESFSIPDVLYVVISRVTWVVFAAEKSGIRFDWLDRIIGEISSRWDHATLARKQKHLSTRVVELREELGKAEQQLGDVRAKMTLRNFCPGVVSNDKICIIADHEECNTPLCT